MVAISILGQYYIAFVDGIGIGLFDHEIFFQSCQVKKDKENRSRLTLRSDEKTYASPAMI